MSRRNPLPALAIPVIAGAVGKFAEAGKLPPEAYARAPQPTREKRRNPRGTGRLVLTVKGDRFQAAAAATKRGIPFAFEAESRDPTWTYGYTSDEHRDAVARWFAEAPYKAPYPVGSLLLYNYESRGERANPEKDTLENAGARVVGGHSYRELSDFLGAKSKRPVGNNTWAVATHDGIAIRLHRTDIVTFFRNGDVRFDSGGYRTVTTKARMNSYARPLGASIYADRGQWWFATSAGRQPFVDGISIATGGGVRGPMPAAKAATPRPVARPGPVTVPGVRAVTSAPGRYRGRQMEMFNPSGADIVVSEDASGRIVIAPGSARAIKAGFDIGGMSPPVGADADAMLASVLDLARQYGWKVRDDRRRRNPEERASVRSERRRGFQPPWYTVYVYTCPCGQPNVLRKSWHGPSPRGGFKCSKCDRVIDIASGEVWSTKANPPAYSYCSERQWHDPSRCHYCKTAMDKGAKFCVNCGKPFIGDGDVCSNACFQSFVRRGGPRKNPPVSLSAAVHAKIGKLARDIGDGKLTMRDALNLAQTYAKGAPLSSLRDLLSSYMMWPHEPVKHARDNPSGDRVTVKKENDEWVAVVYRGGKRDEAATYYASDKQDAEETAQDMRRRLAIQTSTIGHVSLPGVNLRFNPHPPDQCANWPHGYCGGRTAFLVVSHCTKCGRDYCEPCTRAYRGMCEHDVMGTPCGGKIVPLVHPRGTRSNPSLMLVTGNPGQNRGAIERAWCEFHQRREFTGTVRSLGDIRGVPSMLFALGRLHAIDFGQGDCTMSGNGVWVCANASGKLFLVSERHPMDLSKLSGTTIRAVTYDPMRSSGKDPAYYKHEFHSPKPSLAPIGNSKQCRAAAFDGGRYEVRDWIYS